MTATDRGNPKYNTDGIPHCNTSETHKSAFINSSVTYMKGQGIELHSHRLQRAVGQISPEKIRCTLSSLPLLFCSTCNTSAFPKYTHLSYRRHYWLSVNSAHSISPLNWEAKCCSPVILNVLHAGTIHTCQVRAKGRGRGSCTLYIALGL